MKEKFNLKGWNWNDCPCTFYVDVNTMALYAVKKKKFEKRTVGFPVMVLTWLRNIILILLHRLQAGFFLKTGIRYLKNTYSPIIRKIERVTATKSKTNNPAVCCGPYFISSVCALCISHPLCAKYFFVSSSIYPLDVYVNILSDNRFCNEMRCIKKMWLNKLTVSNFARRAAFSEKGVI